MLRFDNGVRLEGDLETITRADIEYFRRKILTDRAVISELKENTVLLSSLYEAAKTLLTVIEFTLDIFWIQSIHIKIHDDLEFDTPGVQINISGITRSQRVKDTRLKHIYYSPNIRFNGILCYTNSDPNRNDMQYKYDVKLLLDPDDFSFMRYVNPSVIESIRESIDQSHIYFKYSVTRNPNRVLAYAENFPSPSVLISRIRHQMLLPHAKFVLDDNSSNEAFNSAQDFDNIIRECVEFSDKIVDLENGYGIKLIMEESV